MEKEPRNNVEILRLELEEILKHKWIESEKAGYDLGDQAVWDWVKNYAFEFREYWEGKKKS
jgi:hypothetical protein